MKRITSFGWLLAASASTCLLHAGALRAGEFKSSQGKTVPDQYIVVFEDGLRTDKAGELAVDNALRLASRAQGFSIGKRWNGVLQGALVKGLDERAARALAALPGVAYVTPDVQGTLATIQTGANDHIAMLDQRTYPGDGNYEYSYTGSGVDIYIVDSGFNTTRADFTGRASQPYNGIAGSTGAENDGHGYTMAMLAGGSVYGVAKNATLKSVRVVGPNSSMASDLISGLDWIRLNKTNSRSVVNVSIIYPGNAALNTAVNNLIASGAVVVVAAGNKGLNGAGLGQPACGYSPAGVAGAFTVSSAAPGFTRQSWANYGACVDAFAWSPSGTSESTALVSGVAALIWEQYPTLSATLVQEEIRKRATKNAISDTAQLPLGGAANLVAYSLPVYSAAPAAPASFTVATQHCFGANDMGWTASTDALYYEAQRSVYSNFNSPSLAYSGPDTLLTVNVTGTTYYRVRACNGMGCSTYRVAPSPATYTNGCL